MNNLENVHFSSMPNISIPRSRIPLKQGVKGSCNFGTLVPVDAVPVYPGDDFAKIIAKGVIRMSQPIVPIMDDIECNMYAFFVPYRLLWSNFEDWYTTGHYNKKQGDPVQLTSNDPYDKVPNVSLFNGGVATGSIANHFGKPLVTPDATKTAYGKVNVFKERAYFRIWSDWFIPRQLVTASPDTSSSGSIIGQYVIGTSTTLVYPNSNLLPVCKSFDYFTAATISPQYSSGAVAIPLGTTAPVIAGNSLHSMGTNYIKFNNANSVSGSYPLYATMATTGTGPTYLKAGTTATSGASTTYITNSNLEADLSQASAATINALRQAFAVQKYCERSNYGNRFFEAIVSHFGVTSPDARLQRSEYFGHAKFLVNVDQVVSTAGYSVGSSQLVGAPGAISITGFKHSLGSKGFVEPGVVVILMSTRQVHHTYSQGIMREDSKLTKFEWFSPEFANLGDQDVKMKELFLAGSTTDETAFGYQEHWGEDRYRPARVCGLLDPNATGALDYWTLADKYASAPNLNANFIFENRDNIKRCLTTGTSGPDFIYDLEIDYVADRPMPVYTIPGLIDHFGTR